MKYFDSRTHGEVLSRVTNDVDTLSQSLNQSLTQIITAVTTLVGVLIMMLTISWLMTLVTFVILADFPRAHRLYHEEIAEVLPGTAGIPRPY